MTSTTATSDSPPAGTPWTSPRMARLDRKLPLLLGLFDLWYGVFLRCRGDRCPALRPASSPNLVLVDKPGQYGGGADDESKVDDRRRPS